jgi:hypothetical protein
MGFVRSGLFCIIAFACAASARGNGANADEKASRSSITSLIPADCIVAYFAKPYSPERVPSSQADEGEARPQFASILALLNVSGLVPDEGQVFADIAARLPLFGRYEHAAMLLDISSRVVDLEQSEDRSDDISLRLNNLQSAVIFRTGRENADVLQHMNQLVGRYTNKSVAKLKWEKAGSHAFQRLVDDRMYGWAVWEWGEIGDYFVLCFGQGSFERIASTYDGKTGALANDPWFVSATVKAEGVRAHAQWFIALKRLESRLSKVAGGRFARVVKELQAENITHDLWTVGREGRAMSWYRCYRRGDEDVVQVYSDPRRGQAHLRRIIPDSARHYAIIHVPTQWLVDNLPRAWVAAQSEGHIQKLTAAWERLEEETGIDIGRNLIDHLGENIVIHDFPAHPLNIPFALTIAIEITDRKAVATATDTLLSTWSRYLDQRAERKGTTLVRLYVKRDPDGIWFLQAGILGPAMKVTDRYLVISWSPPALREALKYIEGDGEKTAP